MDANRSNVRHNETNWFITHCLINCSVLSYAQACMRHPARLGWLAVHRHIQCIAHPTGMYYCVRLLNTIRYEHTVHAALMRYDFFSSMDEFFFASTNENETERNNFFHFPIQCSNGYDVFITPFFFSRSFLFTHFRFFSFLFFSLCSWWMCVDGVCVFVCL